MTEVNLINPASLVVDDQGPRQMRANGGIGRISCGAEGLVYNTVPLFPTGTGSGLWITPLNCRRTLILRDINMPEVGLAILRAPSPVPTSYPIRAHSCVRAPLKKQIPNWHSLPVIFILKALNENEGQGPKSVFRWGGVDRRDQAFPNGRKGCHGCRVKDPISNKLQSCSAMVERDLLDENHSPEPVPFARGDLIHLTGIADGRALGTVVTGGSLPHMGIQRCVFRNGLAITNWRILMCSSRRCAPRRGGF